MNCFTTSPVSSWAALLQWTDITLPSCSKVFFKTNYEKVKTLFNFILKGQKYFLLSHKMLFCSMFAIEHDSFNSYSSALTEVINPLYVRLPSMMLVLNIEFFKIRPYVGFVRTKNK